MCFNPSPVRRVPSPNRYIAIAKFCFCKNNKRLIELTEAAETERARLLAEREAVVAQAREEPPMVGIRSPI